MKSTPKFTISVGIPAHNEARNIAALLDSILSQNSSTYTLEKIVVLCDGCTDDTAQIVSEYTLKNRKISCVNDGVRIGKTQRLNQLYSLVNSDVLVIFDGDVILKNRDVIKNLIRPFQIAAVGLVGGNNQPLDGKTFVEKIAGNWSNIWFQIRWNLNRGDNVHNLAGCIYAMHKKLYKKINIPPGIKADDEFLYFENVKEGYGFKFALDALVNYRHPTNLHEYFIQTSRFISTKNAVAEHFGDWVEPFQTTPFFKKLLIIIEFLFFHPILTITGLFLQSYLNISRSRYSEARVFGIWTSIKSSKQHD